MHLRTLLPYLLALALTHAASAAETAPQSIAWQPATLTLIEPRGDYARMTRLPDGRLACVFDRDGKIWIRHSTDEGRAWADPVLIAQQAECWLTNAAIISLRGGKLLAFWNERPLAAVRRQRRRPAGDLTRPFLIQAAASGDQGATWTPPRTLYTAGALFRDGCWEPAPLELPSGELHVYFANESPYRDSDEQEISLLRSADGGDTWSAAETVSMRANYRDGMPAPLLLADAGEVVVAIEDNGLAGDRFKPAIVRTPLADNWRSGPVPGDSPRRHAALQTPLDPAWYGGAPFLARLPSGATLLSYQESEDGSLQSCRLAVCLGDSQCRNFTAATYPLANLAAPGQLWNSLFVKNETTVTAIAGATINGVHGIWTIDGMVTGGE